MNGGGPPDCSTSSPRTSSRQGAPQPKSLSDAAFRSPMQTSLPRLSARGVVPGRGAREGNPLRDRAVGEAARVVEEVDRAREDDRHRGRALTSYDPNIRPSLIDDHDSVRRRVLALIDRCDVVKASDEDVAWLHPGEDIVDVARRWSRTGPGLVVVTTGRPATAAALQGVGGASRGTGGVAGVRSSACSRIPS